MRYEVRFCSPVDPTLGRQTRTCSQSEGTSDTHLWISLQAIAEPVGAFVAPPAVVLGMLQEGQPSPCHSLLEIFAQFKGHLLAPLCLQGHWTLLTIFLDATGGQAVCFDGIPGRNAQAVRKLPHCFCEMRAVPLLGFQEIARGMQTDSVSCGPIALAHAASWLGTDTLAFDQHVVWAVELPPMPALMWAAGSLSDRQKQQLQELVQQKGVPPEMTEQKCTPACFKLGAADVAQALAQKQPWPALKALANKPSQMFRWVQADELQSLIENKATQKFGTSVPKGKQKKQPPTGKRSQASTTSLDPALLQMSPGSFTSSDGQPICQLAFDEAQPQMCGMCFCSVRQIAPSLSAYRAISVDALVLATTSELKVEATQPPLCHCVSQLYTRRRKKRCSSRAASSNLGMSRYSSLQLALETLTSSKLA